MCREMTNRILRFCLRIAFSHNDLEIRCSAMENSYLLIICTAHAGSIQPERLNYV